MIFFQFLTQNVAILTSYPYNLLPVARLGRSAFHEGGFTIPCKAMHNTLVHMEQTNLVTTSGVSVLLRTSVLTCP